MKSKILWKLFAGFASVAFFTLLILYFTLVPRLRGFLLEYIEKTLIEKTLLVRERVDAFPPDGWTMENMDPLADRLAEEVNARVTIVAPNGVVLGDSTLDGTGLKALENHAGRPEIAALSAQTVGEGRRYSTTAKTEMLYVAVKSDHGFARLSLPLDVIAKTVSTVKQAVLTAALFALLLASGLGLFISRSAVARLREMSDVASHLARGDYSRKLRPKSSDEIGTLARTINNMAAELEAEHWALVNERNQLKTVLDSMVEGVMVIDENLHIRLVNPAFREILCFDENCGGKTILECLRNNDVDESVQKAIRKGQPVENEIVMNLDGKEKNILIHTAPLKTTRGKTGSVSVFYDMTEIRKLENIRREFVANVSHELKTPLTSIRGYAETLRSGALKDTDAAMRFAEKIEANAIQLQELVDDILKLSEIESGRMEVRLQSVASDEIIDHLLREFDEAARKKKIALGKGKRRSGLQVEADPKALGQILANLVDNAVKYTPEGGIVEVSAVQNGQWVKLSVRDTGIGIAPEDLSRIFERFYRVDKARSRSTGRAGPTGGTGLGLSIVKHLVQAQGGEVFVESKLGKGSVFSVTLPVVTPPDPMPCRHGVALLS